MLQPHIEFIAVRGSHWTGYQMDFARWRSFIDAGANYGLYVAEALRRSLVYNFFDNVVVHEVALGAAGGDGFLYVPETGSGHSLNGPRECQFEAVDRTTCPDRNSRFNRKDDWRSHYAG